MSELDWQKIAQDRLEQIHRQGDVIMTMIENEAALRNELARLGYHGADETHLHPGICMVCHTSPIPVRYLPIFTNGSEGLYVCEKCGQLVTDTVRNLIHLTLRVLREVKINAVLKEKQK